MEESGQGSGIEDQLIGLGNKYVRGMECDHCLDVGHLVENSLSNVIRMC